MIVLPKPVFAINIDRQYTSLRRDGLIARLSTFQKPPHCALYNFLLQVDVVWLKAFFNKSLQLSHIHVIYPFKTRPDGFRLGYVLGRRHRKGRKLLWELGSLFFGLFAVFGASNCSWHVCVGESRPLRGSTMPVALFVIRSSEFIRAGENEYV